MDSYQQELRTILKTWVFSFNCASCIITEKIANLRIVVSPYESKEGNDYNQPPSIVCECDEILYNFLSKDLYDLFLSLYDTTNNNIYISRNNFVSQEETEESFDLMNT